MTLNMRIHLVVMKTFLFLMLIQKVCKNISGDRTEIKQNSIKITEYYQKIANFIQELEEKRRKG